jgi:hypothetical protein
MSSSVEPSVKLRLSLLSKRRQAVLAVRTFVRANAKKRVVSKLELSSTPSAELAFVRATVSPDRVDGLAGRLLR